MKQEVIEHGCVYHIFNRGNNREDIFKAEENYAYFLFLMKKYLLQVADIYAYCLLKNHFHLLIRIKDIDAIQNQKMKEKPYLGLSHLLNSYTQGVNKVFNRSGSLFQEHPKRILVTNDEYLQELVMYIHTNPIKHGFTVDLDYLHSSYQAFLSDKKTDLDRKTVLGYFGDKENFVYCHKHKKITVEEIMLLENVDI